MSARVIWNSSDSLSLKESSRNYRRKFQNKMELFENIDYLVYLEKLEKPNNII